MSKLKFDKREPCKSCPYRRDAPLNLWSIEEFEGVLRNSGDQFGSMYGCHEYNKRKEEAQVCIGWLLDQRDHNVPSIGLRLTLIDNPEALACMKEAHSDVDMYDSVEEMCDANGIDP